jgi:hypothetical protein
MFFVLCHLYRLVIASAWAFGSRFSILSICFEISYISLTSHLCPPGTPWLSNRSVLKCQLVVVFLYNCLLHRLQARFRKSYLCSYVQSRGLHRLQLEHIPNPVRNHRHHLFCTTMPRVFLYKELYICLFALH